MEWPMRATRIRGPRATWDDRGDRRDYGVNCPGNTHSSAAVIVR
jgi:hypothetical protein